MIFRSLAEFGFSREDVLDQTPHLTHIYMSDVKVLDNTDERQEARLRANLDFYKDKRLLRMKYEKALERHLEKVGTSQSDGSQAMKKWIIDKVRNG